MKKNPERLTPIRPTIGQVSPRQAMLDSMSFSIEEITDRACAKTHVLTEILERDTKVHPQRDWIVME